MRTLAPPLVLLGVLGAGCAAADAPTPAFIDDFVDTAIPVECTLAEALTAREQMVGEVVTLNDTSFMVVYPQQRHVVVYGPDLRELRSIAFDAYGPTGVIEPSGAALVGDSLLYIADKPANLLKVLDLEGGDRGTVRLDFPPEGVQAVGESLLVTPLVVGRHPRWLVYDVADDDAAPRRVPTMRITDALLNALANMSVTAAFPDGRVVVGHRFVVPFAHVLPGESPGPIRRVPIPLPDGIRSSLNDLPEPPLSEDDLRRVPAVMLAAAPDGRSGDLLYIVRTGRRHDGYLEKAIVRVDTDFGFHRAYLPGVNAIRLAYLADRAVSIIADEEDRWYTCPTP